MSEKPEKTFDSGEFSAAAAYLTILLNRLKDVEKIYEFVKLAINGKIDDLMGFFKEGEMKDDQIEEIVSALKKPEGPLTIIGILSKNPSLGQLFTLDKTKGKIVKITTELKEKIYGKG